MTIFSQWKSVKEYRDTIGLFRNVRGYDRDWYAVVTNFEKGTNSGIFFNKVHILADTGKDTWRKSDYLRVNNEQRAALVHTRQLNW